MMKTNVNFSKIFLSMLCVICLLLSCSKDGNDGAVGPQGPQGEQGPQGAQGAQGESGEDGQEGAQGEQGEPGTANVIYSDWIDEDFLVPGASEENLQGLEVFSASELDILTDVVLVYGRRTVDDNPSVYQLPYIFVAQDEYYGFGLFTVTGGIGLQVRVSTLDGGTNIFSFFDAFRYVVIPGGNPASGKSSMDFNKMSYEEITTHFNIPK